MVALSLTARGACAADSVEDSGTAVDTYTQMLRRYDAMNAELRDLLDEVEGGAAAGEYPKRILSLQRNSSVTVGGELRTNYTFSKTSGAKASGENFKATIGDFFISTAKLSVDARMGDRWRAFVDLNLSGHQGFRPTGKARNPDGDPEFLNQAYIELMKGGHTGFGAIVGLVKPPFGLWRRPNLFAKSFLDSPDLDSSYLGDPESLKNGDGIPLPHASRFMDPAVTAMLYYEMRDIIRFDAAVFQEREAAEVAYRRGGGEDVRGDEALPRSFQLGASFQPLENWELTAHFRNRYSRAHGIDSQTPGAVSNEQALVVGAAAEVPGTNLSASVEYAHGWNQGFNKYIDSDSVNVALAYRLTPRMTLHAQGEWLHVKDRFDGRNNHLYRAMLGAEYELAQYLTLEAGWQYEYWKARSAALGGGSLATAGMVYFGTRFIF